MTVKELIKKLKKCNDKNATVYLAYNGFEGDSVKQVAYSSPVICEDPGSVYISDYKGDIGSRESAVDPDYVGEMVDVEII